MTGPLQDTWASRDFPVLVAAARLFDERAGAAGLNEAPIAAACNLDRDEVLRAMVALDGAYLRIKTIDAMGGTVGGFVTGLTERGRRTAGLWPTGEGVDALVNALNQAAEESDDEEDRNWLRRAAGALGQVTRGVATDVVAAVITKQING